MNTIKMLGFAATAALSLGVGAAMAQEGPNAEVSGSTYFGPHGQMPLVQAPYAQPGAVQSGSSDVEVRPFNNNHYYWTPGNDSHNAGSEG